MDLGTDLLRIENLGISFAIVGGPIYAVRSANLRVLPGKVTALVGESGSGKSVISQAVMGILPRTAQVHGRILFSDPETPGKTADILEMPRDGKEIRSLRGRRIGKIFQEPMTSLSPLHTIGNQISEVLQIHTDLSSVERRERTEEMLGLVGFPDPKRAYDKYSFELSGRPAPARHDRHGADLPPRLADRRRADDGSRCDDPGADPAAAARSAD